MERQIQITDASEHYGRSGFVIEFNYGDSWAVPAWEEWGFADFAQTFETREAAAAALDANGVAL